MDSDAKIALKEKPRTPEKNIVNPTEKDILLGRNPQCWNHKGNQRYRALILDNQSQYHGAGRRSLKTSIVADIVDQIISEGGRFLRKNRKKNTWYEVDRTICVEKVGHALRDKQSVAQQRFLRKHLKHLKRPQDVLQSVRIKSNPKRSNNDGNFSEENIVDPGESQFAIHPRNHGQPKRNGNFEDSKMSAREKISEELQLDRSKDGQNSLLSSFGLKPTGVTAEASNTIHSTQNNVDRSFLSAIQPSLGRIQLAQHQNQGIQAIPSSTVYQQLFDEQNKYDMMASHGIGAAGSNFLFPGAVSHDSIIKQQKADELLAYQRRRRLLLAADRIQKQEKESFNSVLSLMNTSSQPRSLLPQAAGINSAILPNIITGMPSSININIDEQRRKKDPTIVENLMKSSSSFLTQNINDMISNFPQN